MFKLQSENKLVEQQCKMILSTFELENNMSVDGLSY